METKSELEAGKLPELREVTMTSHTPSSGGKSPNDVYHKREIPVAT